MDEPHESRGPGHEPRGRSGVRATLRRALAWGRSLAIAFLLFLILRTVGVEAFKIPTSSMEATLQVGDFLLVNKAMYGAHIPGTDVRLPALREPARNDVIVFRPPHEPRRNYVKRVVGLPGDTLEMRDKRLVVNGEALDEPWAIHIDRNRDAVHPGMRWQGNHLIAGRPAYGYSPSRDTWGPIVVPAERFFVLGDNRDNSEDSRYWGWVDRDRIRGRPWFVYYSWDRQAARVKGWFAGIRWDRIGRPVR